jgi:hypothetical protein
LQKLSLDRKNAVIILFIWQLVTSGLLVSGIITPKDVQALSTADWMKASEIEINSSLSLLEKGYCLVNKIGSTVYAFDYGSGYLGNWSTNGNVTIQWALNNGSGVLVKAANYGNVVVTLNNGNHLIIEKNATSISWSVASGAYCEVEDHQTGYTYHYDNGVLRGDGKTASYVVDVQGANYRLWNGSKIDFQSTNLTLVEQCALGNFSSGLLYLKDVQFNTALTLENTEIVIEEYQGSYRSYSNQGKGFLLMKLAVDPDTSGWGDAQIPYWWYNTGEDTIKYWNGSATVLVPGIGGGSITGTYILPDDYTIYKSGSTYYAEDDDGSTDSSSTNALTVLQYAINAICPNGGSLLIKCRLPITTGDLVIPSITSTIIIHGLNGRAYLNTFSQTYFDQCRSNIFFDGHTVVNGSTTWQVGKLIIRDMALGWTGVTNTALFCLNWIIPVFDNCLLCEWDNTYSANGARGICTEMGSSTPELPSGPNWRAEFHDCNFQMTSDNTVGIYAHYEPVVLENVWFEFYGATETGMIVDGVKENYAGYVHCWFGSAAEGCTVFKLLNVQKTIHIEGLGMGAQNGAGDSTPNVIFGNRSTITAGGGFINFLVGHIMGDEVSYTYPYWTTTPTTPVYMFANSLIEDRTMLYGTWNGDPTP